MDVFDKVVAGCEDEMARRDDKGGAVLCEEPGVGIDVAAPRKTKGSNDALGLAHFEPRQMGRESDGQEIGVGARQTVEISGQVLTISLNRLLVLECGRRHQALLVVHSVTEFAALAINLGLQDTVAVGERGAELVLGDARYPQR